MIERGQGSIIVIGATAALRYAVARFSPASHRPRPPSARSPNRWRAFSGRRESCVAYVVVDDVIDRPNTRRFLADRPDDFFLSADAIADSVLHLIAQNRSAWTFELDLRTRPSTFR